MAKHPPNLSPPATGGAALCLWLILGASCALPLAWLLTQLLLHPRLLAEIRLSSFQAHLLARTLLYNSAVAATAVLLALPAALVVGRGRGFLAATVLLLFPVALVMPSVSYTYGWVQFFRLLGITFLPAGLGDILRCIWTLAAWLWPLPAIAIGLSLRYSDSQIQQQALLDGALWRITARILAGPAAAGFVIVLVLAMQEFAVYERGGISVVATEVRTVFELGELSNSNPATIATATAGASRGDLPQRSAAALATALPMLLIVAALSLLAFWLASRSVPESADVPSWPRCLDAGRLCKFLALAVLALTLLIPIISMLISISPQQWRIGPGARSLPTRTWLWAGPYMLGSLLYGGLTALAALLLAALASLRRSRRLFILAFALFLLGGQLLAIADIRIYSSAAPWPLNHLRIAGRDPFALIYNNAPIMVLVYLGRFAWLALLAGNFTWSRSFRDLRDLAAVDGAGPLRTAIHVVLPLAWPMFAAAAILVMIFCMTEVSATILLQPQRPQMLVPCLMGWIHLQHYDNMLAGTLLLSAATFLLALCAVILVALCLRLTRALRSAPLAPLILLMLLIAGCDEGTKPQAVWCETGPALGQLLYPRGIAYSPKHDCFFVVDRTARVQRIESDGHASLEWRMPLSQDGKPVGLSVGPDGNVYVADTHYFRIMVYSPDGKLLRSFGSKGRGPGQFIFPTDVAFDSQGNIYVSEYGDDEHSGNNDRIQVFDPAATRVLRTIGRFGQADGEFARPQSMLIDGDLLYVTDACNHRIAVFKTDGTFLRNIGAVGSNLGQFRFPYGLADDGKGHLVITEFGNNRVQLVDKKTGQGLKAWGHPGREPGQLAYPWAADTDKRGRTVVVDSGNNRLQVFAW